LDGAFYGIDSLINSDPGVRGILYVTNDLVFVRADELSLAAWEVEPDVRASDQEAVTRALNSLGEQPVSRFLSAIAARLSRFDWRSSNVPGLTQSERLRKLALRGSGGYRELRSQLLQHLADTDGPVSTAATEVIERLGY
jgi:hypothetical protein